MKASQRGEYEITQKKYAKEAKERFGNTNA